MSYKPIINLEAQVRRVAKNSYKELSITFRSHPDEYEHSIEECFFELFESGKNVRLVILEEVEDIGQPPQEKVLTDEQRIAKKRQRLALNMREYAKQFDTDEERLVQDIYTEYNVSSRSQLIEKQLDELIKKYQPFPPEYIS